MDASRFDRLTRSLSSGASRRHILAGVVLSAAALHVPTVIGARKKRNEKVKRNAFGCVDVGKACRGSDANCCSGICQGKKPKQGKKDTSSCVAHSVGECQADQDACLEFPTPCGTDGVCVRTTGKASFCGGDGACQECSKDTDCETEFGPGAACIVCAVNCAGIGGTVCIAAAA
jgi:hypothetical protein